MCGIVGMVAYDGSVPLEGLKRATHALRHRGPDDGGLHVIRVPAQPPYEVALANRRLAILDLSPSGHQPMLDPETGNWIVYNGEVYNFHAIRAQLENEGIRFSSQSDTEVVLRAYGKWGSDCLHQFRGMFALAIWDDARQRLFLARDRLGIKPLYYARAGGKFFFSSEVRSLLEIGLTSRKLSFPGLLSFLDFGSVCDPQTVIEGVYALKAGHYMLWERGRTEEVEYWDVIQQEKPAWLNSGALTSDFSGQAKKEILTEIGALLEEAARLRLVSDVPVGVFLSGGIDSSALVGLLSHATSNQVSTFSIVFNEADYTEAPFSRLIAQRFNTDHHECILSQKDAREAIPEAICAMDQPTMDGVNTYIVSREARRAGLKVALSGLGGDELFAGYDTFRTVPRMERFARAWNKVPGGFRNLAAGAYSRLVPDSDRHRKLAALLSQRGQYADPYVLARCLFTSDQRAKLLNAHYETNSRDEEPPIAESLRRAMTLDPVNQVSYLELRNYMLNTLLRDSDVMSMAHGLEVRVPLIDHKLVEYVFALPGKIKMNSQVPKPLLVEAIEDVLPSKVVNRPKRGFTLPFRHWLKEESRGDMEATFLRLKDGPLAEILDASGVHQVWTDFLSNRVSWSRPWSLYVLQRWCEMHL